VFDLTLPLEQVAEGYRAMDERRPSNPSCAPDQVPGSPATGKSGKLISAVAVAARSGLGLGGGGGFSDLLVQAVIVLWMCPAPKPPEAPGPTNLPISDGCRQDRVRL